MKPHELPSVDDRELFGDDTPPATSAPAANAPAPAAAVAVADPPKPKRSKAVGAASSIIDRIMREQSGLLEASEEILRQIVDGLESEGGNDRNSELEDELRSMDPLHRSIFTSLGLDDKRILEEGRRVERVVHAMAVAGSKAELTAAEKALSDADQQLKVGSDEIDQQIADLQAKRRELATRAQAAKMPLERMTQARHTLRNNLPEMIQGEYQLALRNWTIGIQATLNKLKQRASIIGSVISWTISRDLESINTGHNAIEVQALLHCRQLPSDHPCHPREKPAGTHPNGKSYSQYVTVQMFAEYQRNLRAELEQLEASISELEPQSEAERRTVEELKDYYIDQLG